MWTWEPQLSENPNRMNLLKIETCCSCWLFRKENDSFEVEWRLNLRINYKVCNYFWFEYAKNGKKTWNQRELNRIRDTLNQNWNCWRCFWFVIFPWTHFRLFALWTLCRKLSECFHFAHSNNSFNVVRVDTDADSGVFKGKWNVAGKWTSLMYALNERDEHLHSGIRRKIWNFSIRMTGDEPTRNHILRRFDASIMLLICNNKICSSEHESRCSMLSEVTSTKKPKGFDERKQCVLLYCVDSGHNLLIETIFKLT